MTRRHRSPRDPNKLVLHFAKFEGEEDWVCHAPRKGDGNFVLSILCEGKYNPGGREPSFVEELVRRGYDRDSIRLTARRLPDAGRS